jgi:hypothetical protein
MNLFEYCVIYKPKENDNKKQSELAKVIVPVTTILAENAQTVTLKAARQIPETYANKMDQCEVAVRPF